MFKNMYYISKETEYLSALRQARFIGVQHPHNVCIVGTEDQLRSMFYRFFDGGVLVSRNWLWIKFRKTPTDQNDCITREFARFKIGTKVSDIEDWFVRTFDYPQEAVNEQG